MNFKKINKNNIHIIAFCVILVIAILSRTLFWPNAISQINVDEAMTAINANSIAQTGKDIYGTSFPVYLEAWGWAGQSVMLLYFMVFFIKLFGLSMFTVRLPLLIISIISIIIFYDFTRRIFNNKTIALFGMAFVSICPWHLLQSIWSIDCNMFPHFMLISVYLLYCGIINSKNFLTYLSMLFFALTMYTYGVSIYVVPLFLLICAIYLLVKKKINLKTLIICIIIYLFFSSPILAMYVLNAFKIEKNICIGPITIQYFVKSTRTDDMLIFSKSMATTLFSNLKSLTKVFIIQYDNLPWNSTKFFGTIYHISLPFFFVGITYLIIHKEKRNIGTFFFGVWLALSFLLGLLINKTNINRLNIIWFPTLFFSFYGLYVLCNVIFQNKKLVLYCTTLVYTALFVSFCTYLYGNYTKTIDMSYCFAGKTTDAIFYATNELEKHVVFYTKSSSHVYLKFEDALNNTSSEHLTDLNVFENRLNNKTENEVFLINKYDLEKSSISIQDFSYNIFGNNYLILGGK